MTSDGVVAIVDRSKDLVISGGVSYISCFDGILLIDYDQENVSSLAVEQGFQTASETS